MSSREIQELIEYYREQGAPQDQQMLVSLLRELQEAAGGVLTAALLEETAGAYGVKPTMLTALIRRVPGLRGEEAPHRLEVCGTCRAGAKLRAEIEQAYGVKSGEICRAYGFSYHVTPCMKNCASGPSIRWDGKLHSRADIGLIRALLQGKDSRA